MVPFMKSSAEVNAQRTKAIQEDLEKLQNLQARNDDRDDNRTNTFPLKNKKS